jgi:TRAP-type C4-dicarboxylate transport system permease small subunit
MKTIDFILDSLLFIILAVMSLVVGANVFCRFVLGFSIYWGDELAQVLLVWLTFLGAAVATREYAHYAFNYLLSNLKGRWQIFFTIFSKLITISGMLILLYYSTQVSFFMANWTMPALGISRTLVYGACPLGTLFMLVYATRDLWQYCRLANNQI